MQYVLALYYMHLSPLRCFSSPFYYLILPYTGQRLLVTQNHGVLTRLNLPKPPSFQLSRETASHLRSKLKRLVICASTYSNQGRWLRGLLTPRLSPQWIGKHQTLTKQRTIIPVTDIKKHGKASFICTSSNSQLLWVWKRGRHFLKRKWQKKRRQLENRIKRFIIPPSIHTQLVMASEIEYTAQSSSNILFNARISCFCRGRLNIESRRTSTFWNFFFS